ncbi:MAG: SigE family RNA polymerase sigma factor [Actinomycetota bacterium]
MDVMGVHNAGMEATTPPLTFDDLFGEYYEPVLRALYLLTRDAHEAEDLAQEAFVIIYEQWNRLSTSGNPAGYVYRTAVNVHRSRLRRIRVAVRRFASTRAIEVPDDFEAIEARDELRRALGQLSRKEREALVLVVWVGMSEEEAGKTLGTSSGSIRTRISRAKDHLRETLKEGIEDGD